MLLIYIFYKIGKRESEFRLITHVLLKNKDCVLHCVVLADAVRTEDVHALRVLAKGTGVVIWGWSCAAGAETGAEADYSAVND